MQTDYPCTISESTNAAITQHFVDLTLRQDNTFGSPQVGGQGGGSVQEADRVLEGTTSRQRRNQDEFLDRLDLIDVYRLPLVAATARELVARAAAAEWWEWPRRSQTAARLRGRAARLGVQLSTRYADAQAHKLELENAATGEVREVCTCKMLTCSACESARSARLRRWASDVVPSHDQAERARGRESCLLTLTLRDSGDAAADLALLRAAWPRFYLYLRRQLGVGPYLYTEELTAGRAGQGHVHWHVVLWLEPWVDYAELHRQWWSALARVQVGLGCDDIEIVKIKRAVGEAGERSRVLWSPRPDCGGVRPACGELPCSHHTPGAVDVQRNPLDDTPASAVGYVTKAGMASTAIARAAYALKTADEWVSAAPLAHYMVGRQGKRRVVPSLGFWRPAGLDVRRRSSDWRPTGRAFPARVDRGVPGWHEAFSEAAPRDRMGPLSSLAAGRGAGAGGDTAVKGAVGAAEPAQPLDGRGAEGNPPGRAGRSILRQNHRRGAGQGRGDSPALVRQGAGLCRIAPEWRGSGGQDGDAVEQGSA